MDKERKMVAMKGRRPIVLHISTNLSSNPVKF